MSFIGVSQHTQVKVNRKKLTAESSDRHDMHDYMIASLLAFS